MLHKLRDTLTHYAEAGLVDFHWDDSWDRTSSDPTATAVIGTTAGATTIVDTDRLNTNLSLAALCLLKEKVGGVFAGIDVRSEALQRALHTRPPCRWEIHRTNIVMPEGKSVSVEAVLDVGHNPAAMGALTRRINSEYSGRPVRYHLSPLQATLMMNAILIELSFAVVGLYLCRLWTRILYAMSRDKDVRTCLRFVLKAVPHDRIHFAQVLCLSYCHTHT